jgi:hypothetical protein
MANENAPFTPSFTLFPGLVSPQGLSPSDDIPRKKAVVIDKG